MTDHGSLIVAAVNEHEILLDVEDILRRLYASRPLPGDLAVKAAKAFAQLHEVRDV